MTELEQVLVDATEELRSYQDSVDITRRATWARELRPLVNAVDDVLGLTKEELMQGADEDTIDTFIEELENALRVFQKGKVPHEVEINLGKAGVGLRNRGVSAIDGLIDAFAYSSHLPPGVEPSATRVRMRRRRRDSWVKEAELLGGTKAKCIPSDRWDGDSTKANMQRLLESMSDEEEVEAVFSYEGKVDELYSCAVVEEDG